MNMAPVPECVRKSSKVHSSQQRASLSVEKVALARRMHDSGESAATIAAALGVSRATVYRVLSDDVES
jgi:DNA invertase Pin-like site-specific DNA recombinase